MTNKFLHKISPLLLNSVSALSNKLTDIILMSSDFNKTKSFLRSSGYNFTPHRFANCFKMSVDATDLDILSSLDDVKYINANSDVFLERAENDVLHISNLTENKYFGQNQTICFIDTGIYPHLDFIMPRNRLVKFIDLTSDTQVAYDDNGHGTFVTGLACGGGILSKKFKGFAPLSNIISIKALNKDGNSNANTILDAMQWVYENHRAYNISVLCLSLGTDVISENDPLTYGADILWKRGITVVAAAGNSGPDSYSIKSPGNNPNIITVGGLDIDNMRVADFSSRGPTFYGHKPDLVAPAVNIMSCNNSSTPYTIMSGTSVATPIVAGICADIKSRWPKIKNYEIKKFLLSHCTKIANNKDIEGAGYLHFD